ncbi:hypothetical protein [uncultured Pseudomonas sp.]|uniref:hypothetical protein n=1 Tax=uncultured Pseudomonas sp. TaxID=114707 RepID=UPI00259AB045|nr:hypothetical protein [uncultured Pseudomonas sp.]
MKERPILFKGPLVRAILSGQKTVTRRPLKMPHGFWETSATGELVPIPANCPYGKPGDRLWVRETWGVISHDFDEHGNMIDWEPDRPASPIREMPFGHGYYSGHVIYRADGEAAWAGDDDGGGDDRSAWKPSIHMPRIASRILLEITDVRVERLQDISDAEIEREGIDLDALADGQDRYDMCHAGSGADGRPTLRTAWRHLWESTGGNWDGNPWVWVVEFKRVTPP